MAFIRKKIKKGNDYYYVVESRRCGDKVKQVILEYIGPLENLIAYALKGYEYMAGHSEAEATTTSSVQDSDLFKDISFSCSAHGAVIALFQIAQILGIESIMDSVFTTKVVKGLPRSRILLLAMIHRAIDPGSKRAFASWAKTTSLPYHLDFDPDEIDSQTFWEAMDGITSDELREVWSKIVQKASSELGIEITTDLKTFHLDYSNYYTFIDSRNNRCVICRRGHNKQKRDDLRQFSIAVVTAFALQIPIVWELYDGNRNDKQEFPVFIKAVEKDLAHLGVDIEAATLSFDGGSNSEESFKDVKMHILCAHSMAGMPELYEIDLNEYKEVVLSNGHSRKAYRIEQLTFSGVNGTGVLTYSPDLEQGQIDELNKDLSKTQNLVEDLADRLKKTNSRLYTELRKRKTDYLHKKRDIEEQNQKLRDEKEEQEKAGMKKCGKQKKEKPLPIWNEESEMLSIVKKKLYAERKRLEEFTDITVQRCDDSTYDIKFTVNEEKKRAYCRKYFGKKLTCTDHTEYSTQQILDEYGEQECIENGIFRVSKDVDHFAIRPQFHWTDDKIWVHTYICLTAIVLAEVLRAKLENEGIKLTKHKMLERLHEIHDGWIIQGDKKVSRVIENLDPKHAKLWEAVKKVCKLI